MCLCVVSPMSPLIPWLSLYVTGTISAVCGASVDCVGANNSGCPVFRDHSRLLDLGQAERQPGGNLE